MPAVTQAYATLVFRYTKPDGLPPENEPWNCFPFSNEKFREVASIKSVEVGLTEPPTGKAGATITPTMRSLWPRKAEGALKFLRHCDAQRRKMSTPPTIESFQTNVLKTAPGREDWEWIVDHFFGVPGGLYGRLRDLMRDNRCDAEEAYRWAREEEMELKGEAFRESHVQGVCKFDNVWLPARDNMALAMCGDPRGTGRVPSIYHSTLRAICYRLFESTARTLQKNVTKLQPLEARLSRAYKDANEHPTLTKLRTTINLYGTVLSVQRALGIRGRLEELGIWRQKIDSLMESLGRKVKGAKTVRVTARHKMAHIVSDEDLTMVWLEYRSEIWTPKPPRPVGTEPDGGEEEGFTERPLPAMNAFPLNAGVERWLSTSSAQIQAMLGLPKTGLPGANRNEDGTPVMHLMWHQWASVLEMVDRTFTLEGEPGRPTLLADEVGMGKTAQVIAYLQVLWHLKAMQDLNDKWPNTDSADGIVKWPEFLGERKSFMGKGRIPALPTAIACPTTLVAQWRHELSTWLSDTACHILVYRGSHQEREGFFADGSPYDRAMKGPHPECTIVLIEVPSLQASGRTALLTPGDRARAEPSTGHPDILRNTWFSRSLLLAVLEEAHGYRNWNPNFRTMLTFMSRASQAIVLTATPVHTHPRDLLNLGRLSRSQRFVGSKGAELTKIVEQKFKESGKAWDSEEEQELLRQFLLSLRGSNAQSGAESSDASVIIDLLPQQENDLISYRAFWATREGLFLLRAALEDILIRRDERSKDIDGNPLLSLLPKIEITSYIKLDAQTEAALNAETATKEARNQARMDLDGFFTRLKKILVHVLLMTERNAEISLEQHVRALFPDLDSYLANPSPKIDRVVRILKHHSGDNNTDVAPLSWDQDGTEIPSDDLFKLTPEPTGDHKRRKFVVYCHLSQSWTLVGHVLKLHGIESVRVNGSMEPSQRDAAVKSFQSEEGPDVVLLSDAGAQGLNLQRGSIVLYVDHPWSASESQQIDGRVQRRGQKRQVIVYRLMAPGTPDEYLLGYADGKRLMMQVFTQECVTHGRPGFEHEDRDPDEEETFESESEGGKRAQKKPRGTKVAGRGLKDATDPSQGSTPDESTPVADTPAPPKSRRKPAAKSSNPKPEKFIHPDFPDLGPRPKEGTRARNRWDKKISKLQVEKALVACQIQREIEDKVRAQVEREVRDELVEKFGAHVKNAIAASSANVEPSQPASHSGAVEAGAAESGVATKASALDKGKGKVDETQATDKGKGKSAETQANSPPPLTAMQANMLSMLCENQLTVDQAQRILQMQNEPPLPSCVLPASDQPEATGSATAPPPSVVAAMHSSDIPMSSEHQTLGSNVAQPPAPTDSPSPAVPASSEPQMPGSNPVPPPAPIASNDPVIPSAPATPTRGTSSSVPTSPLTPVSSPLRADANMVDLEARTPTGRTKPPPALALAGHVHEAGSPLSPPPPPKRARKEGQGQAGDASFVNMLATSTPRHRSSSLETLRPHVYAPGTQEATIPDTQPMDTTEDWNTSPEVVKAPACRPKQPVVPEPPTRRRTRNSGPVDISDVEKSPAAATKSTKSDTQKSKEFNEKVKARTKGGKGAGTSKRK